tara:strand:- start:1109 stop:1522 length:414 start_codon:yes stop_codon:yes gene_type:complete
MVKIEILDIKKSQWKYFWVKTIKNINLEKHCAKTFEGEYLDTDKKIIETEIENIYICGVSSPYNYKNNLHLPLTKKLGSSCIIKEKGVLIKIINAEVVKIKNLAKGEANHKNRFISRFYSCRNWQYAYQISKNFFNS